MGSGSVTNNFGSGSDLPVHYGSGSVLPGHLGSGSGSRSDKNFGSGVILIRIYNTGLKLGKWNRNLFTDLSFYQKLSQFIGVKNQKTKKSAKNAEKLNVL